MSKSLSTSFYLSPESKEQLRLIADQEKRSQAKTLEVLINAEFKRLGLKITAVAKPKK